MAHLNPHPLPEPTAAAAPATARNRRLPELLAPAGNWMCARAAVENGADAIYFGLEKFNARMRADNFTEADLPTLMEFLHRRGVKGYVTFNTLIFEDELPEAERWLRTLMAAGADAAIVQDIGICRLIRRLSPDFPIHASTQMTVTSAAGVEFARDLGCQLVVLARECSIKEIEGIHSRLRDSNRELPLEVFIHGALCVAYSGQCLTSESLGGRSANRGECAQACRMPYELIADGQPVPLGDRKYLLSPQDLAGLEVLPELIRAGVTSLKIEGRLKTPEYVASITQIYRDALDGYALRLTGSTAHHRSDDSKSAGAPPPKYRMEMAFSRGLHTGWLEGINNQRLVHGRFGKKRGVFLGTVVRVSHDAVVARLEAPLKRGDGVVFDAGRPEAEEEGGRIYDLCPLKTPGAPAGEVRLEFGRGELDFTRIGAGNKIWKTSDPELDRRLRRSFTGEKPVFRRRLSLEVHGSIGRPLTVIARDEAGNIARADSAMPLVRAETRPLDDARLREQLGRLGGTPFQLGELTNHVSNDVLLPVSELNSLRRKIIGELEQSRARPKRWTFTAADAGPSLRPSGNRGSQAKTSAPELIVLVRNAAQLQAALGCAASTVYCEFEDPKKYRDAVSTFRNHHSSGSAARPEIFVAPPRIFKTGEEWTLEQVRSSHPDGYLVRNYDHLKFFSEDRRIGDYSFNIANRWSAEYFKTGQGLERLTPSYDLNCAQLEALLQGAPPEWFEVTIHQHMPMFHMEHCVFCAFLSSGTDYTNCGRPCDHHDVRLRDRVGAEHPLKADAGCRNTVFNGLAQTGAEYVSQLLALGLRHFRVEFLNETPDQVKQTILKYRQLLNGEISGAQLWRELKLLNQLGVTRGQMAAPGNDGHGPRSAR